VVGALRSGGGPGQRPEPVPSALTWRLYDKALLIAVAYPILLPVGQWVVTGDAARIGSFEFLPAAPFWWDRAVAIVALAILTLGFVARNLAAASRHRVMRQAADWLPMVAGAVRRIRRRIRSRSRLA
jgi:hypothetical protein